MSWTEQFSVFNPLNSVEEKAHTDNRKGFQQRFPSVRLFPDPSLNVGIRNDSPSFLKDAIIIVNGDKQNRQIAEQLNRRIAEKYDISLDIISDESDLDF